MKSIKSFLTSITLLLSFFTAKAYDYYLGGLYYNKTSDTTVTVTFNDEKGPEYNIERLQGSIIIPSTICPYGVPYRVTSIGEYAFYSCINITSIYIPDGVTSIGSEAFLDCHKLSSITLPESLTTIDDAAFYNCDKLYTIFNFSNLPISKGSSDYGYIAYNAKKVLNKNDITTIDNFQFYTFENTHYLFNYIGDSDTLALPNNFKGECYLIDNEAFENCSSIFSITIPESVTSIGNRAFHGCENLTSVNIPNSVKSIGISAFYECRSLSSISIPESISSIEYATFAYCSSLSSITLPKSIISIGEYAFYNCRNLSSVSIPENVNSIGRSTFYGCSSLSSITIPKSITSIEDYAFYGCSKLLTIINHSSIPISAGSDSHGHVAFYAKKVLDGNNLTTIGDFQFYTSDGKHYLANYTGNDNTLILPDNYNGNNYIIGDYAFYNCSNLLSISIPNSVTNIGSFALYGTNLQSLIIGSGVISIGYNILSTSPAKTIWLTNTPPIGHTMAEGIINYVANDQYTDLKNVQIYPYLSSMFEVNGVKYVPVSPSERTCHAIDCSYDSSSIHINIEENTSFKGVTMKVTEVMPYIFYNNDYIEKLSLSHVGSIGDSAFYDCDNVKTLEVSNMGKIGERAFYDCNKLKTIKASNHGDIEYQAFYNCDSIETINISCQGNIGQQAFYECDNVKTLEVSNMGKIGEQAFYNCDKLKTIKASNHGDIEYQAFYNCDSIETINIYSQGNIDNQAFSNCDNLRSAFIYNQGSIGHQAFYSCDSLKIVLLGDSINYLGSEAFYGCISLQEIVIPDSVKSVGSYCFSGCSSIKSALIGKGVANVMPGTFSGCTALSNVTIGDNVINISSGAFENCSSLLEITLPQTITELGNSVFKGCTQLADVIIEDRTTVLKLGSNESSPLFADCPLDSVYIGGKISYSTSSKNGYSPFYRNTSLRTVVIANSEDQIYDNEFYGCTNLKNVSIGNGVKSIGNYAFSGCNSLDRFSFGSNMESIGSEAFSDCTNLTSITSHAATPPVCGEQALDDINKWNCVLRVPSGYADAYQQAEQWKEFFFIEDVVALEHYILTYLVDGEIYHCDTLVHNESIVLPEEPTKEGHTFNGWDGLPETMPAQDLTINASFTVNTYKVYYYVGEELVHTAEVAYGDTIPEYIYEPSAEGEVFKGWEGETYETMPAHDVTYKANIINGINSVLLDPSSLIIYDLQGRKITNTENLQNGIYIINDQKVLIQK